MGSSLIIFPEDRARGPRPVQQQDLKMNDLIAVQKIAGWEKLKTLVLDSVSCR